MWVMTSLTSAATYITGGQRNRIGARLCVKHQPQHIERLCGIGLLLHADFARLLRLVYDTAALRRQCVNTAADGKFVHLPFQHCSVCVEWVDCAGHAI
jgi:hypothetical protein